jgi:large subunit ribosomal protein L3
MPGQMGNRRVTVRNLSVVDIRPEENLLILKGAVPGSRNNLLAIFKQ